MTPDNLLSFDPEISLFPAKVVEGLARADAEFSLKRADYALLLRALANVVYRARLRSGGRIVDPIDFKLWLEELSEAIR